VYGDSGTRRTLHDTQPIMRVDKRMLERVAGGQVPCDAPSNTFRIDAGKKE
jgi:hypothetical protein